MSTSSTVPKRQLGMALRQRREHLQIDRETAARVLDCSPSKIGRIEQGEVGVKASELRDLLDLYKIAGQERSDLELLGSESRKRRPRTSYGPSLPDWFRRYVSLEDGASRIKSYDIELIPGLFQTEDYAREIIAASPLPAPGDVDRLVQARMARQDRLAAEHPPEVWAVLAEGALRQQVGGEAVMREQLRHLGDLARRDCVTLQVLPFTSGAHAATGFAFTLLRFPHADGGLETVYLEDLTSARYIDDKPDEQQRYAIVWNHLTRTALPPDQSVDLLDTLVDEP